MSDFSWKCAESRRTAAARKKAQRKAREEEEAELIQAIDGDLSVPDFLCGLEYQLEVPVECMGMVIGKKGERLKALEERHHVKVIIKDAPSNGTQSVIVQGRTRMEALKAAKELDMVMEQIPVPAEMTGWVCGKGATNLKFLRELTDVPVLTFIREDATPVDESGTAAAATGATEGVTGVPGWVEIKGPRDSVANAKLCLEEHMSYFAVARQMAEVQRDLDRQIAEADAQLGRRPGSQAPSKGAMKNGSVGKAAETVEPAKVRVWRSTRGKTAEGQQ